MKRASNYSGIEEGRGYCSQRVTVTGVVTGRRWKKTGHWGPLVNE
jgi:hypothetical protein